MNTSKKSLLTALLLGIALLFGITQNISANASQPYTPQPSPTPEILENGWVRFTDAEAEYSFDYPPELVLLQTSKNKGNIYKIIYLQFIPQEITEYGYQGMTIFVEPNPQKLSLNTFLSKYYKKITGKSSLPNTFSLNLEEKVTVGKSSAIKTTLFNSSFNSPYSIIFINKNNVYIVGPSYANTGGKQEVSPETEKLFLTILDTFMVSP